MNSGPDADAALHADRPAVRFDDMFRDGETQARPPKLPRPPLVDAVEPLEDPGEMLRGDPRPVSSPSP